MKITHYKLPVLKATVLVILLTNCAIILKNPVIVHNDNAPGDIYFHKEFEETDTKEQTSRKQTAVTATQRVGSDDIEEVNDKIEVYDKQKAEQVKKADAVIAKEGTNSTKAKLELLRVNLIDAKIRRTLCEKNYLAVKNDSLVSDDGIREAKECWENSEQQVVELVAEIRAIKEKMK